MTKRLRRIRGGAKSTAGGSGHEVGYRKPPLHSRFKPGQSGNPHGRPKRKRATKMLEQVQDVYLRDITVLDNGKKRRMPAIVLLIHKLLTEGLKGDRQAALASYKFAQQLGVLNIEWEQPNLDLNLTEQEHEKVMDAFQIMRRAKNNAGIGSN